VTTVVGGGALCAAVAVLRTGLQTGPATVSANRQWLVGPVTTTMCALASDARILFLKATRIVMGRSTKRGTKTVIVPVRAVVPAPTTGVRPWASACTLIHGTCLATQQPDKPTCATYCPRGSLTGCTVHMKVVDVVDEWGNDNVTIGTGRDGCDLAASVSLITKTFQATHCFDHLAFPRRL